MAKVRKRKRVGGWDSARTISELAPCAGGRAKPVACFSAAQVSALAAEIDKIVEFTLYERVAAHLWRAGVRSATLAKRGVRL